MSNYQDLGSIDEVHLAQKYSTMDQVGFVEDSL